MLYRLLIILGSVVLFVNGCNSILSGLTGTHKLRTLTIEEVEQRGIGDADYVEITGAWCSGMYQYAPPRKGERKGAVQYPVMSAAGLAQLEAGEPVHTTIIAWTEAYDPNCLSKGNCSTRGRCNIKGIARKIPKEKNKVHEFPALYEVPSSAIYIETDRAPLAWYWHLAIMGGAVAMALGTEFFYYRRKQKMHKTS
jgi:hypothetical protein